MLADETIVEPASTARGVARSLEPRILAALSNAVQAPSGHNAQPWRFRVIPNGVELYADASRRLPVVDPEGRELAISCGAVLYYLRLTLRHFGLTPTVAILPSPGRPDLVARVSVREGCPTTPAERRLFAAIRLRHTNRRPFEPRPVPAAVREAIAEAAWSEGAWFHAVEGEPWRSFLLDLIAEGDRLQMGDPAFRRELAGWLRPASAGDGLTVQARGLDPRLDFATPLAALVIRGFDLGRGQAERDRALAAGAPMLAVIGTDEDTPEEWLLTGEALARLLLVAADHGVAASFPNQPVEVPELRERLRDGLDLPGVPQMVLRLGYGPDVRPTPRRPLESLLVE